MKRYILYLGIIAIIGMFLISGCAKVSSDEALQLSRRYMQDAGYNLDDFDEPSIHYLERDKCWFITYFVKEKDTNSSDFPDLSDMWPGPWYEVQIYNNGKLKTIQRIQTG